MSRWTNVKSRLEPAGRRTNGAGEKPRKDDYLPGPFPWSEPQAVACFEAYGWAGGAALVRGLAAAWENPRPPCFPPHEAISTDAALTVMLTKFAEVRGYVNAIEGQMSLMNEEA